MLTISQKKRILILFLIKITLQFDVPDNLISLHFKVPNNQIPLNLEVPDNCSLKSYGGVRQIRSRTNGSTHKTEECWGSLQTTVLYSLNSTLYTVHWTLITVHFCHTKFFRQLSTQIATQFSTHFSHKLFLHYIST